MSKKMKASYLLLQGLSFRMILNLQGVMAWFGNLYFDDLL